MLAVLIVRLKTSDGTLVVEIEDSAASVQVDGGDLVITGIGSHEIRLRAGQHHVMATKDHARLLDEDVSIVKGGKTAVRVRVEPPAAENESVATAPQHRPGVNVEPAPPTVLPPGSVPAVPLVVAFDAVLPKSPRLVRVFKGHSNSVRGVAFLRGGLSALTAGLDGTLRIWDMRSGWELYQFGAEGHRPSSLALLPEGRALTAGEEGSIVLWNLAGIRELRRYKGHEGAVVAVVPVIDGSQFITSGVDRTVRLWDIASGQELRRFQGHERHVLALAVTKDGARLLTAGVDGTVRLWELATGRLVRTYAAGKTPVRSLSVSPNGRHFLFAGDARLICAGDLETGAIVAQMGGHTGSVGAVTIAPDWRHAMSTSEDGTLRVWDLVAWEPVGRVDIPGNATALAVAKGSRLSLTGGADGIARLWLIPLAPGESGEPTPTEIIAPVSSTVTTPKRPSEFLEPLPGDLLPRPASPGRN